MPILYLMDTFHWIFSKQAASPQVSSSVQDEDEEEDEVEVDLETVEGEEEEEEDVEVDPRLTFLWPQPQQVIQKNGDRFILSQDFSVQLAAIPQSGNDYKDSRFLSYCVVVCCLFV